MPIDPQTFLPAFDRETRIELNQPGTRKEVGRGLDGQVQWVRFARVAPERTTILYHRLGPAEADAAIEAQIADITRQGLHCDWKTFAHDQPADLPQRLLARGWVPDDPDAIMALDLEAAPPALLAPVMADVRPITTRAGLDDVIRVLTVVWGTNFEWVTRRLGDHLEIPGYLNVYAAYVDGTPASAAWIYFLPASQFASLWAGSTVAEMRGRGLYSALLATRVQAARTRGYRYLTVDAGEMSRPIVARHGFEQLTATTSYEWPAPAE
jgi:GNAT superfamily N-acetyltransferase